LQRAREAIGVIRGDVRGVTPINAHMGDPEGFDADIDLMTQSLRELLDFEGAELFPLIDRLGPGDVARLRQGVESACAHQTSLPDPPAHGLLRKLAEIRETVGLTLNDHSTPWHPGVEALLHPSDGAASDGAA
jgi:hypothetical protein